jgi:ferredoxin
LTRICYFSGTGNCLWSAKEIARLTGDQCELINIGAEAQKSEIILEADALAVVFPAYAYGAPLAVRSFIKKALFKTPYIALFVTYGTSPGGALAELSRILKHKGTAASYCGRIPAVENYIAIFGPQKEKTKQRRLELQKKATEDAARAVIERRRSSVNTFRPFSAFVSTLFSLGVKLFYRAYRVSADCNGCGICERLCAVSAISMREGRPCFSGKCEHCQACLNWCPQRAIHFGRLNTRTPRYHHPEITLSEISRQELPRGQ